MLSSKFDAGFHKRDKKRVTVVNALWVRENTIIQEDLKFSLKRLFQTGNPIETIPSKLQMSIGLSVSFQLDDQNNRYADIRVKRMTDDVPEVPQNHPAYGLIKEAFITPWKEGTITLPQLINKIQAQQVALKVTSLHVIADENSIYKQLGYKKVEQAHIKGHTFEMFENPNKKRRVLLDKHDYDTLIAKQHNPKTQTINNETLSELEVFYDAGIWPWLKGESSTEQMRDDIKAAIEFYDLAAQPQKRPDLRLVNDLE